MIVLRVAVRHICFTSRRERVMTTKLTLCSEIVRSLAFCMISGLERPRSGDGAMRYIRSPLLRSLIDPLRYADTIMESTEIVRRERELIRAAEASEGVRGAIARVLKQVDRPTDVKDVVRGLFVSDVSWIPIACCKPSFPCSAF